MTDRNAGRAGDPLEAALRRAARRMGVQRWMQYFITGVMAGAGPATLWVIVARMFPLLGDPKWVCVGLFIAGAVISTAWAAYRWPSLLDAALETDRRLGLRERLTSSLELAGREGPMIEALHADARRRLAQVNLSEHFPLVADTRLRWVYVPLLILGLAYIFFPELDLFGHKQRRLDALARQEAAAIQAAQLLEAVRPLKKESLEEAQVLADVTAQVEEMAQGLRENALNEKQALARLTSLANEIEKRREVLAENSPMPKLVSGPEGLEERAIQELAEALKEGRVDEALKKTEELIEKLKDDTISEEEREKLAKDFQKLSDMLGSASSQSGEPLRKAFMEAARALRAAQPGTALEAMEGVRMGLEDLQSLLEQLEAMEGVSENLKAWASAALQNLGEYDDGQGMRGPGRGQGTAVGDLPDIQAGFQPTVSPGPTTKGKMLADILQRVAPTEDAESNVELLSNAFVQVQQEAEKALTRQEIPPASKEFVRRYFGSLEPEKPATP